LIFLIGDALFHVGFINAPPAAAGSEGTAKTKPSKKKAKAERNNGGDGD
jgi:hypothetical protein